MTLLFGILGLHFATRMHFATAPYLLSGCSHAQDIRRTSRRDSSMSAMIMIKVAVDQAE